MTDYKRAGWTCEAVPFDGRGPRSLLVGVALEKEPGAATERQLKRPLTSSRSTVELHKSRNRRPSTATPSSSSMGKGLARRRDLMDALRTFARESVAHTDLRRKSGGVLRKATGAASAATSSSSASQHDVLSLGTSNSSLALHDWQLIRDSTTEGESYGESQDLAEELNQMESVNGATLDSVDRKLGPMVKLSPAEIKFAPTKLPLRSQSRSVEQADTQKSRLHNRSKSLFSSNYQFFHGGKNANSRSGSGSDERRDEQKAFAFARQSMDETPRLPDKSVTSPPRPAARPVLLRNISTSGIADAAPRPSISTATSVESTSSFPYHRPRTQTFCGALPTASLTSSNGSEPRHSTEASVLPIRQADDENDEAMARLASQLLLPSNMAPDPAHSAARRHSTVARRYAARVMMAHSAGDEAQTTHDSCASFSATLSTAFGLTNERNQSALSLHQDLQSSLSLTFPDRGPTAAARNVPAPLPPRRQALRARVQSSSDVRELSHTSMDIIRSDDMLFAEAQSGPQQALSSWDKRMRRLQRRTSESSLGVVRKEARPATADSYGSRNDVGLAEGAKKVGLQPLSLRSRRASPSSQLEQPIVRRASEDAVRDCSSIHRSRLHSVGVQTQAQTPSRRKGVRGGPDGELGRMSADSIDLSASLIEHLTRTSISSSVDSRLSSMSTSLANDIVERPEMRRQRSSRSSFTCPPAIPSMTTTPSPESSHRKPDENGEGGSPVSFTSAHSETWGSCHSSVSSLASSLSLPKGTHLPSRNRQGSLRSDSQCSVPPVPTVPAKYASLTAKKIKQFMHDKRTPARRCGSDASMVSVVGVDRIDGHAGEMESMISTAGDELQLPYGRFERSRSLSAQRTPVHGAMEESDDEEELGSICLDTPTFGYVASFATAPVLTPRASDCSVFNGHMVEPGRRASRSAISPKLFAGAFRKKAMQSPPRFTRPQFQAPFGNTVREASTGPAMASPTQSSIVSGSAAQSAYDTFPFVEDERHKLFPFKMNVEAVSPKTVDSAIDPSHTKSHVAPRDALRDWEARLEAARRPSEPQHGLGLSHIKLALAENTHTLRRYTPSPTFPAMQESYGENEVVGKGAAGSLSSQQAKTKSRPAFARNNLSIDNDDDSINSSRRMSFSHQGIFSFQNRGNSFRIGANRIRS